MTDRETIERIKHDLLNAGYIPPLPRRVWISPPPSWNEIFWAIGSAITIGLLLGFIAVALI